MFIHAPIDVVADCLVSWGNEEMVGRHTTAKRKMLKFDDIPTHLSDRKFQPDRGVLVSADNWTAFFDNHQYEWLAAGKLFVLCERLKVSTCFFSFEHDRASEQYGEASFNYSRFNNGLEIPVIERQVMLSKDGRWKFEEFGEPMPFENLERYAMRKKRDRLNEEVLISYGKAIGIAFWDIATYAEVVVLLKWGQPSVDDNDSALKKIMSIFGKPAFIMDRDGIRKPPD